LCLGSYRGIRNNLRWILGDTAGTLVTVDANMGLADRVFHHIAGVLDRDIGMARLYVDGVAVGMTPLANLAAATSAGPITIGNCPALTAPFAGTIDEVRLSSTARRSFAPVLGESDARYRQRLAIFQPWRVPSYPTIRRCVRALTLSDPTQLDVAGLLMSLDDPPEHLVQFDVDETDSKRFCASRWLRIIPDPLSPGQSIAADGTMPAIEPDATGTKPLAANAGALLSEPDGANYQFAATSSRSMVLATARMLERLAARLAQVSPASILAVESAYVAVAGTGTATTNDNLGLTVTVGLTTAGPGFNLSLLAALAFESGAPFVSYQASPPRLRLVAAPTEDLDLRATSFGAGTNPGTDPAGRQIVPISQPVTIAINRPIPQPVGGLAPLLDWSLLPAGPAAGALSPSATANAISFTGTAPGVATIAVRCTLPDGVTLLVGSLPIMISPQSLDGCDILGGDGTIDTTEQKASGPPDNDFNVAYLVTSSDPSVDYAPTLPAPNRMQLPLETALLQLAQRVARETGAPRIRVVSAYDPTATDLRSVGRGLVVQPSSGTLTASRLGALAFQAGFSYIERRRYPPSVYLSVPAGNRFEIVAGPPRRLWPNARISGRGALMASEFDAAGPPDTGFNPAMLQPFTDPRAVFAAGVSNQVQASLATALTALLAGLIADGAPGALQIVGGFTANDPTLLGVGRAVLVRHPTVAADRLAGYALRAGFGFVEHRTSDPAGPAVYMASYPAAGPPLSLLSNANANAPYYEVALNTLTELSVRPPPLVDGRLDWGVEAACPAIASLSTSLPDPADPPGVSEKIFQGSAPGAVSAVATFSLSDFSDPYQFTVIPAAGVTAPSLSKDQYDDLLNFLDAYHPLGTSGITKGLRAYIHGFKRPSRWDRLPTRSTYQHYRGNR
jgi:hypothetical protein